MVYIWMGSAAAIVAVLVLACQRVRQERDT